MNISDTKKLKFSASVEYIQKMGIPEAHWGYYAVLSMNNCEVTHWKLNRMDMMEIFNERNVYGGITEEEMRITRTVDEDALNQFIANKIGDVLGMLDA